MTLYSLGRGLNRGRRVRYAVVAVTGLGAALTFASLRGAHSQASQDGPPAPVSSQRISIKVGEAEWKIPACFNLPIDRPNDSVTRVVVGIHGIDRLANASFTSLMEAGKSVYGTNRSTLILAPQFLTETERDKYRTEPAIPVWKGSRWIQGDDSAAPDERHLAVSSFRVLDTLLARICNGKLFPNLRSVVIAGHSGGGQFVQRYAAGNKIEEQLESHGIAVRYVVANPSSYLYLTDERPASGQSDQFTTPSPSTRRRISFFNNYKYGLDRLNPYMREAGPDRIRAQYGRRQIVYLLGERDNDPKHPQLDRSKAALLEGSNRLERGVSFYHYLVHLYGSAIQQNQQMTIIPGTGHNARRMFASVAGTSAIFGNLPVVSSSPLLDTTGTFSLTLSPISRFTSGDSIFSQPH